MAYDPFFWAECRWRCTRSLCCSACSNGASSLTQTAIYLHRGHVENCPTLAERRTSVPHLLTPCELLCTWHWPQLGDRCAHVSKNFFPLCSFTFLQNLDSEELILLGGYAVSTGIWPTVILLVCWARTTNVSRFFETPVPSRYGVTSQKT